MSRDKFLFSQSARLYQQAEELSDYLLNTFMGDDEPFSEPAAILKKARVQCMRTQDERRLAADAAWRHLIQVSSTLDARFVLPTLLETVEQYYYGHDTAIASAPWLGTAVKTAAASVWLNRGGVAARGKARDQIRRMIAAAAAWEQLSLHESQARALDCGPSEFTAGGTRLFRDEDFAIRDAWNTSALRRGQSHRTLRDSIQVIWRDAVGFTEAVTEVLGGASPRKIKLFQGTVFEEIESPKKFWLGLAVRLHLLAHAARFRQLGREDLIGISIFETFASATSLLGTDQVEVTLATQAMFWQGEWHAKRVTSRDFLSNLLVERPAIRIDDHTFVLGLANMADAINCFVEHSVFRCHGYGGVPVPEEAFRRRVSQPFEDRVVSVFTDAGWKADHVSERGAWCGTTVNHPSNEAIPGEVDVFALHPAGKVAFLVECKVLAALFATNKMVNVAQKLGATDAEGFHRKLEAKAMWLRGTPQFSHVEIRTLIVVDQDAFMAKDAPNRVINIEDLPAAMAESV
jgi:hypothetical protein